MNDITVVDSFCELSKTSLVFKKDVSREDWLNVFNSLKQIEGCVQFWIGDALAYKQQRWGMYDDVADETGYSKNTLREYKQVAEAVKSDIRMSNLSFGHHQAVAAIPSEKQTQVLKKAASNNLTVRETREEVKKIKREDERRIERPIPKEKKYQIIYADPPWRYEHDQEYFGQDVERHYPTMTIEELCELPIREMRDDNCVLYMWTTAPKLEKAFAVLRAWGFEYKTCLVWDKVKHNMGFYASIRHEILLIGGSGSAKPDDASAANLTDSVYSEERTEHSKKPEYFYSMIERLHNQKENRIELFSRNSRDGWDVWGNEA